MAEKLQKFDNNLPLSLYLHLPWCIKKCPYCDFNSYASGTEILPEDDYINALVQDIEHTLPSIPTCDIHSIFIGGGTPSLFSVASIERLLVALRSRFTFHRQTEITIEVNPNTAEAKKFISYRRMGINRLSIGIQSFNDKKLRLLGRIHGSKEGINAVYMAKIAGFKNINLDLMFGLPDQTIAEALCDLQSAIDLQPSHISWYQLTIEPNTVFYTHPPKLKTQDYLWEMQKQGQQLLATLGFEQYEISAYANTGSVDNYCQHNLNYWQFGDYLGFGAGAHSKITYPASNIVKRTVRCRLPKSYMDKAGRAQVLAKIQNIQTEELPLEFMLNALRLVSGFRKSLFMERTGLQISAITKPLEHAQHKALITCDADSIRPTQRGQCYLNDLLLLFMNN